MFYSGNKRIIMANVSKGVMAKDTIIYMIAKGIEGIVGM